MNKIASKDFTKAIASAYMDRNINFKKQTASICYIDPIIMLSPKEEEILTNGDGQSPEEYKQINSSTGLAVNYYKILQNCQNIKDLVFEDKVARPLKSGGRYANLDVSYKRDGIYYYVESKFLEPYYSDNEKNRASYFNVKKYPQEVEGHENEWLSLFEEAGEFTIYNAAQLCRHLLAIYRSSKSRSTEDGNNHRTILQSVTWKMSDEFICLFDKQIQDYLYRRIETIEEESKKCESLFNDFIETINWTYMSFEAKHYNDMLDDIKDSKYYESFLLRYFFQ